MLENILMYWALPSLITMLLIIQWERCGDAHRLLCEYSLREWLGMCLLSAVYPWGLIAMLFDVVWPWLIKERG